MKYASKLIVAFLLAFLSSSYAWAQALCENQATSDLSAVTTSGDYDNSHPGWQAFDGNRYTLWISTINQSPAWIAYQFSSAKKIDRYSIDYSNGSITTRAPRDFELQGYSNGVWRTLDRRTNQTNWLGHEKRSFAVANPGYYSQYRLSVEQDNDERAGIEVISIGELSLESCGCTTSSELIPPLSYTSPGVTASGIYSPGEPAFLAFDASLYSMWVSAPNQTPAWIGYEWSSPRIVTSYSIHFSNGSVLATRAPKNWQLQGWNGVTWVNVDSRTNEINWGPWETRSYTVQTPGNYIKYRLFITDDNDSRAGIAVISIGKLSLNGCQIDNGNIVEANLNGDWHENLDQSTTGIQHYVPTSVNLGPTRFRNRISFTSGGTGQILRLAPNDAHYVVPTTWALAGDRLTVTFTDNRWPSTAGTYDYVYQVLAADGRNLRLKIISQTKR